MIEFDSLWQLGTKTLGRGDIHVLMRGREPTDLNWYAVIGGHASPAGGRLWLKPVSPEGVILEDGKPILINVTHTDICKFRCPDDFILLTEADLDEMNAPALHVDQVSAPALPPRVNYATPRVPVQDAAPRAAAPLPKLDLGD